MEKSTLDVINKILSCFEDILFLKDRNFRYITMNQGLLSHAGLTDLSVAIGLCDADLAWKKNEIEGYLLDDEAVIKSKKPLVNIIETLTNHANETHILITNKHPLLSDKGRCIGVVGHSKVIDFKNTFCCLDLLQKKIYQISPNIKIYKISYHEREISITKREFECFLFSLRGHTSKMAAKHLDLSPRTVEKHLFSLKEKLFIHNKSYLSEVILSPSFLAEIVLQTD